MNRKPKLARRRRSGRGALVMIALLLTSSAILRVGGGGAVAQAVGDKVIKTASSASSDTISDHVKPNADTRMIDRGELGRMLSELNAREARVKERELQIALRSKALAVADEEISKRLETLEQAESDLRQTLALADGAAENDLARLTAVYENMKPKDAAALFEAMEPAFAAGFLGRMRPDVAAAVMAGLTPEVAYTISVILAGRNANAPKT